VILTAALDLMGEVGYGGLTIEAVAARAGVGKSTIYRHWTGKLELVEDAIRTLKAPHTVPSQGTVRQRVTELLSQLACNMTDTTWSTCLPALIEAAERDPEVLVVHRRLARERRQLLVDLLTEGVESGEVPTGADLSILAECLVGPILVRRLLLHESFDAALVAKLVDQLLPPVTAG